ncbi:MAG: FumA C-terminus/TtdB family hydratase beta subunit [Coriobacteriales bacterium]|jgi:tartrate/fumarate subfamily iron-sulfur-dependent hydro-lyase alpha chain/tartrate/fumarate subfamily iron-sulfur-dependent hydro-lyase beta chain|nr:FumA C-terminus/TtdB family hydratase beta subunit [Coriobacteriales bacterium]
MEQLREILTAEGIAALVERAIPQLAWGLRGDYGAALAAAAELEPDERGRAVLGQLLDNAEVAAADQVPLCQDTGYVWVLLEVGGADAFGQEIAIPANIFSLVDEAVARAYQQAGLRRSLLRDALLDRSNSGDNTPAFCELYLSRDLAGARLHVMLKGGGSDNASRVVMLPPGAGEAGVVEAVLAAVREKGANACPPLVVGVGVGSTFDKVASLAKRALLRPLDVGNPEPRLAGLEQELLLAINALGIGPGGFGGVTTALGVNVLTAPCHIAALPVAVNIGCNAVRSVTLELGERAGASGAWVQSTATDAAQPSPEWFAHGLHAFSVEDNQLECFTGAPNPVRGAKSSGIDAAEAAAVQESGIRLELPAATAVLQGLKAGDEVRLYGPVFTMRDAGHQRALEWLNEHQELPYGLAGQALFYAGPTPPAAGRPHGAIGPTTASRMDFAAPRLYEAGIMVTLGKGRRAPEVARACRDNQTVYLACTGGAAALLASYVSSSEPVAWEDLGTEALRKLQLHGLPAFVAIDTQGNSIYD